MTPLLLAWAAWATTVEPQVAITAAPPAADGGSRVSVVAGDEAALTALRSGSTGAVRAVSPSGTATPRSLSAVPTAGSRTVIAVDQSGSFRAHWKEALGLARALGDATPPGVSVEVLLFGAALERVGVAPDAAALRPILDRAEAAGATQGYTRLRNFIREATTLAEAGAPLANGATRQVVVFTDAGEESTAYSVADVVSLARQSGVILHVVAWQPKGATAARRLDEVKQMAEQTGGVFVQVDDPKGAADAMARLATTPTRAFRVDLGWCGVSADKGDRIDTTVEIEVWSGGQRLATTGAAPFRQHAAGAAIQPCAAPPAAAAPEELPAPARRSGWPWWWWLPPLAALGLLLPLLLRRRTRDAPAPEAPAPPPPAPSPAPAAPAEPASPFPPAVAGDDPLERLPEIVLIKVRGPAAAPERLRLHKRTLRLGASPDADVRLDAPQVSGMHATLQLYPNGTVYVTDTGSTNGTWVGDQRLQPHERVKAGEGQIIQLSRAIAYRVERPGAAPQHEPPPAAPVKHRTIIDPVRADPARPGPKGDA